ncbi:hypothetical protein ACFX2G_043813 [Malus domestica]
MIAIFWRVSPRLKRRNRRDFSAARTGSPELNGSARPAVDGSFRSDPVRPVGPGSSVRPGSSGPTRSDPVRPVRSDPVGRQTFLFVRFVRFVPPFDPVRLLRTVRTVRVIKIIFQKHR